MQAPGAMRKQPQKFLFSPSLILLHNNTYISRDGFKPCLQGPIYTTRTIYMILHVLLHCILGPSSQHEPLYIYCMHKDLYDLFAIVFITCYKIGATYLTTGVLSEASGDKLEEKINTSILDNSTVTWSYSHFLL